MFFGKIRRNNWNWWMLPFFEVYFNNSTNNSIRESELCLGIIHIWKKKFNCVCIRARVWQLLVRFICKDFLTHLFRDTIETNKNVYSWCSFQLFSTIWELRKFGWQEFSKQTVMCAHWTFPFIFLLPQRFNEIIVPKALTISHSSPILWGILKVLWLLLTTLIMNYLKCH